MKGEKEQKFRSAHPMLEGGLFISIDCIPNYELIRELSSFGKELIVLEPSSIEDEIYKRINEMNEKYSLMRTMCS